MDPHMTREDADILEFGPHRRLRQTLSPQEVEPVKKKKLVNFKISLKGRWRSDDKGSIDESYYSTDKSYSSFQMHEKPRNSKRYGEKTGNNGSIRDSRPFDETESISNYDDGRAEFRNFNEGKDYITKFNEERDDMRNFNKERDDMRNFNKERDDMRNFNKERDDMRNFNEERSDIRNLTERREDTRNDNGRREDLRNVIDGRDVGNFREIPDLRKDVRTVKEKREDFRRIRMRTGDERREDDKNANVMEAVVNNSVSSGVLSNKNTTTQTKNCPKSILTQRSPSANPKSDSRGKRSLKSSYTSWDKIRTVTTNNNAKTNRLDNVVEMVTTLKKRTGCPAPTIWTPSVPRSMPTPRPANFQNQEEPGHGHYVISFISRATSQTRQTRQRRQISLPYKQSQSHYEWETRGKMYVNWLKGVITNPDLQEGIIMKGLEIAVPYPILHMREKLPDTLIGGDGERRVLEGSLGSDCVLHQGVYEEVVSWVPELLVTCPSDPSQWARCYIVIGFKTLDGELNEKMETLWKEWTGALYIYCNIDDDLGLKKLAFYRRFSAHHSTLFSYMLVVEVDTVTQENSLHLLDFTYRMRMKHMTGFISVYQEHYPDGAVDVVPGGSPVPSTAQAAAAAAAAGIQVENTVLDLNRISI
ncbi:uncharacterized protein LOC121877758 [Homarus americanus]|uniref:uncharacterized protein LOC121877758 n=1 Tax=Homarus americanus TaxID=6706 RepID=UPI001C4716B7|nr:uncharacterized protein LOC121877758 [Homarus americanus]